MNTNPSEGNGNLDRFQVKIGEEIAWIEVVSMKNKIYAVELPGKEPLFITQIRDKSNKNCWVSMPQGQEELAEIVGSIISNKSRK